MALRGRAWRRMKREQSVRFPTVALALLLAMALLVACAGQTLSGMYAMSANHTIEFSSDGTCVMQDNGVSWGGTYKYDDSAKVYRVTVSGIGGTAETYTFAPQGDDLVMRQNGYEFTYEKQ